ncbi:hypothetical protein K505DRAFT_71628 [Melanomma pulvis-pyrius CBS 109.77]|uniref:Uncharacterized protein n=1 Tax=Melanomma pulvis-pyrius CBS 109.77 TaxID=1314802 RepID=A0A6A6X5A6_9PLEO|nr:hypothetical protein K505DRAFT_71628 [Melanomma pulvis-pyrius CBS 109.77]
MVLENNGTLGPGSGAYNWDKGRFGYRTGVGRVSSYLFCETFCGATRHFIVTSARIGIHSVWAPQNSNAISWLSIRFNYSCNKAFVFRLYLTSSALEKVFRLRQAGFDLGCVKPILGLSQISAPPCDISSPPSHCPNIILEQSRRSCRSPTLSCCIC